MRPASKRKTRAGAAVLASEPHQDLGIALVHPGPRFGRRIDDENDQHLARRSHWNRLQCAHELVAFVIRRQDKRVPEVLRQPIGDLRLGFRVALEVLLQRFARVALRRRLESKPIRHG